MGIHVGALVDPFWWSSAEGHRPAPRSYLSARPDAILHELGVEPELTSWPAAGAADEGPAVGGFEEEPLRGCGTERELSVATTFWPDRGLPTWSAARSSPSTPIGSRGSTAGSCRWPGRATSVGSASASRWTATRTRATSRASFGGGPVQNRCLIGIARINLTERHVDSRTLRPDPPLSSFALAPGGGGPTRSLTGHRPLRVLDLPTREGASNGAG